MFLKLEIIIFDIKMEKNRPYMTLALNGVWAKQMVAIHCLPSSIGWCVWLLSVVFGIDDFHGKYAAGAWDHACGKRGAADRAAVRVRQFGARQYDERGACDDNGDQSDKNDRKCGKVRGAA